MMGVVHYNQILKDSLGEHNHARHRSLLCLQVIAMRPKPCNSNSFVLQQHITQMPEDLVLR